MEKSVEDSQNTNFGSDMDEDEFDKYDKPSERNNSVIDENLLSDALLHQLLPKIINASKSDHQMIQNEGLVNQTGKFSKIETAILNRNWQNYLRDYYIPNKLLLFGYFSYNEDDEDRKTLKNYYHSFAKSTNLYLRLAKDLPNRTLFQVYARARVLFSGLKKALEYNADDKALLTSLYREHGEDYRKICEKYGFDPKSAREFIRNKHKSTSVALKNGPWSDKEIRKLQKNVKRIMKKNNLKTFDGIPWSQVAANMKRSDIQCRQRFFSKKIVQQVIPQENDASYDQKFEIAKLLTLLKKLNFLDEAMIDWDFIKAKFAREHFNILLRSWRVSKMSVPEYMDKTLPQIVDYLYQVKVLKKFGKDNDKLRQINEFVEH